jgi:CarD family transcriptional regulator
MPSAKKSDKKGGAGVSTASASAQGSTKSKTSRASSERSVPSRSAKAAVKAKATTTSSVDATAKRATKTKDAEAKTAKSAAKTAKTAAKTSAKAPAKAASGKATAKSATEAKANIAATARAPSAAKGKASRNTSARGGASTPSAKAHSGKAASAEATSARTSSARKPVAVKVAAKSAAKTAATVKSAQKTAPAKAPKPIEKPAVAAVAGAPIAPAAAAMSAKGVDKLEQPKPAPATAAAAVRAPDAKPPFPAKTTVPTATAAGKISSTTTADEDKKLAKRNEPPFETATPVAAEKSAIESKAVAKPVPPKAKPAAQKHGFKLNEFIVYPAHGVGQIIGMETQEVAGFSLELFVVSFIKDKMILKVPMSKIASVGMRKLAETGVVDKALATLSGRARIKRTMWSRRAQEYEAKINSGDLVTIAEVVRDLYRSETQPEQSYSERQLYEAALDRMARELAAVRKLIDSEALKLIESFLQKGPRRGQKADVEAAEEGDDEDVDRAA